MNTDSPPVYHGPAANEDAPFQEKVYHLFDVSASILADSTAAGRRWAEHKTARDARERREAQEREEQERKQAAEEEEALKKLAEEEEVAHTEACALLAERAAKAFAGEAATADAAGEGGAGAGGAGAAAAGVPAGVAAVPTDQARAPAAGAVAPMALIGTVAEVFGPMGFGPMHHAFALPGAADPPPMAQNDDSGAAPPPMAQRDDSGAAADAAATRTPTRRRREDDDDAEVFVVRSASKAPRREATDAAEAAAEAASAENDTVEYTGTVVDLSGIVDAPAGARAADASEPAGSVGEDGVIGVPSLQLHAVAGIDVGALQLEVADNEAELVGAPVAGDEQRRLVVLRATANNHEKLQQHCDNLERQRQATQLMLDGIRKARGMPRKRPRSESSDAIDGDMPVDVEAGAAADVGSGPAAGPADAAAGGSAPADAAADDGAAALAGAGGRAGKWGESVTPNVRPAGEEQDEAKEGDDKDSDDDAPLSAATAQRREEVAAARDAAFVRDGDSDEDGAQGVEAWKRCRVRVIDEHKSLAGRVGTAVRRTNTGYSVDLEDDDGNVIETKFITERFIEEGSPVESEEDDDD